MAALCAGALAQKPGPGEPPKLPPGLYAVINTSLGTITAELYEQLVPNTVRTFVGLARGTLPWLDPKTHKPVMRPLYDSITFHRVIPDFMIQTGDPTATGAHNCGFTIKDEIVKSLKFDREGRLAMANNGARNSGACQFFITDGPYPAGDAKYTIFGQVVDGQNVVFRIARVYRDANDKPKLTIKLINVNIMRVQPPGNSPAPSNTETEPR
jgi:cyclophilin family peptidyl-prolyl cis-trans isomerase